MKVWVVYYDEGYAEVVLHHICKDEKTANEKVVELQKNGYNYLTIKEWEVE